MKKFLVCLPALALVIALSSSAQAENGTVNSATLQAMGLGGMQVMSDSQAMNVRGMGWFNNKSASLAFGGSYANVGSIAIQGQGLQGLGAGSIDGYIADGRFMAEGSHLSEAGHSTTVETVLTVKGLPATTKIETTSIRFYAGGQASSSSL